MSQRQRTSPCRIGIVGTFDLANFGDLLFPEILEAELGRRLKSIDIRRFSHRPMASPPWPYEVRPITELVETVDELDLLVVGGGHPVSFDENTAPGYEAVDSGVPHPGGHWLSPTLVAAAAGIPVAWSAVAVARETPEWARALLAEVVESVDYVTVRDGDLLAELRRVSPTTSARLVPDSAFGIDSSFGASEPATNAALDRQLDGRPYVVVEPSIGLRPIADAIRLAIPTLLDAGVAVIELPTSPVHGDESGLLGDLGRDVIRVEPWPEPRALAALIGRATVVVAHNFHANVVALAYGVPVFRAGLPEGTRDRVLANFADVRFVDGSVPLASAILGARRHAPSSLVLEQVAQLARPLGSCRRACWRSGRGRAVLTETRYATGPRAVAKVPV